MTAATFVWPEGEACLDSVTDRQWTFSDSLFHRSAEAWSPENFNWIVSNRVKTTLK